MENFTFSPEILQQGVPPKRNGRFNEPHTTKIEVRIDVI